MAEDSTRVRPARGEVRGPDEEPCLEVVVGRERGRVYWLATPGAVIGRGSGLDVGLTDDGVSRRHAKIAFVEDGVVTLRDLGSTNGTLVNGAPIDTTVLRVGDRIEIGPDVTLRFDYGRPDERVEPAPAIELSARELEIVALVAEGLTNPEIAARLHISRHTVVSHLSNVFERTGVRTRTELARLATTGRLRARER